VQGEAQRTQGWAFSLEEKTMEHKTTRDFGADTAENRQRSVTINWEVPHHPIVTWHDWLLQIKAMRKAEAVMVSAMRNAGITDGQIRDFYARMKREEKEQAEAARLEHERRQEAA
jgi:hypothetical protein